MGVMRASRRRLLVRVASCALVIAMLAPALGAIAPDLAGWRPDHAHLVLEVPHADSLPPEVPASHTHPYDRPVAPAASSDAAPASEDGVAFLTTDAGSPSAAVAPPRGPDLPMPAPFLVASARAGQPLHAPSAAPEVPPPRT